MAACVFIVGCSKQSALSHPDTHNNLSSTLSQNTTSDVSSDSSIEDESEAVSSDENSHASSKEDTLSKPLTSYSKPSNSSKPLNSKNSSSSKTGSSGSAKKDWFDNSGLAGTQADIGKVVGYTSMLGEEITVVSVTEEKTADGRKVIKTKYSFGPSTAIAECEYCHEFPCSQDGRLNCPAYDPLKDAAVTCQTCGKPTGNGYYGTCNVTINWNDPTKPFVSCNHYSNCLKCGKLVGDGYNGTCHVTWGKNSGITTCNHYD